MSRRESNRESKEDMKLNERGEERIAQRVPMDTAVDVLALPKIPGYHIRWFNDQRDRIFRALRAGYTFINDDFQVGGKLVSSADKTGSCLTKDVGMGTTAYAMMIPIEFYREDQIAKAKKVAVINNQNYREKDKNGFYDAGTIQENTQKNRS